MSGYKLTEEQVIEKITAILHGIRPQIQMHSGDIEFVKLDNKKVYVRLTGACIGCPVSTYTLKLGVEQAIKHQLPDIEEVLHIED